MSAYKTSTNAAVFVSLVDTAAGDPVTGKVFGDITATVAKGDGTQADASPSSGSYWIELSTGAWANKGKYLLVVPSTRTDVSGPLAVAVTCSGAEPFFAAWGDVVANLEADTFARLGAPAGASHAADTAAVKTDTAGIKTKTDGLPSDPADASDIATLFATNATSVAAVNTLATAIKAKTDGLPGDPADASDIAAAFTSAATALAAVNTLATAIKAKTDNLPGDPADASDVAAAFATAATALAAVSTLVTAVKAKTDNLPSDPADASDIAGLITDAVDDVVEEIRNPEVQRVIDQIAVSSGVLTSARVRTYDSKSNADAAYASSPSGGTTGLARTRTYTGAASGSTPTKNKETTE